MTAADSEDRMPRRSPDLHYRDRLVTVYHAEAFRRLCQFPPDHFDAVITDPPYSSGGLTRSDRSANPRLKYGIARKPRQDFTGDNRDQRAYLAWCTLWISECHRVLRPHGYLLMFSDWRQLPTATDAIQAGGLVYRGLITWDKTDGARAPHTGYFRHQAEFIPWGTKGVSRPTDHGGPWPGVYRFPVRQADKFHLTGKPTDLCRRLVQCVRPGGLILDPFAGSGSTLIAAALEGRRSVGIEIEKRFCDVIADRARRVQIARET